MIGGGLPGRSSPSPTPLADSYHTWFIHGRPFSRASLPHSGYMLGPTGGGGTATHQWNASRVRLRISLCCLHLSRGRARTTLWSLFVKLSRKKSRRVHSRGGRVLLQYLPLRVSSTWSQVQECKCKCNGAPPPHRLRGLRTYGYATMLACAKAMPMRFRCAMFLSYRIRIEEITERTL